MADLLRLSPLPSTPPPLLPTLDLALVFGHVQEDALFIDRPIEKDPTSDFRMHVVEQGGKKAQTRVEVLARGYLTLQGPHLNAPVTKLRLRPITGRRHQLRWVGGGGVGTWCVVGAC